MKKLYLLFLIPFLVGATIPEPPKDDKSSIQTQQYLKTIYDNFPDVKVGSFTRDSTTASGTQAITGVGFAPKAAIFHLSQNSAAGEMSVGLDDGTTAAVVVDTHGLTADTWGTTESISLYDYQSSGVEYTGKISSLDADGFTLTWTKTGSPTGTITVNYFAYK